MYECKFCTDNEKSEKGSKGSALFFLILFLHVAKAGCNTIQFIIS